MSKKNIITKEFLINQYVEKEKSISQIAKEINRTPSCVKYNIKKNNIPLRSPNKLLITRELLEKEYVINNKSTHTISQEYHVNRKEVLNKLRKCELPRR